MMPSKRASLEQHRQQMVTLTGTTQNLFLYHYKHLKWILRISSVDGGWKGRILNRRPELISAPPTLMDLNMGGGAFVQSLAWALRPRPPRPPSSSSASFLCCLAPKGPAAERPLLFRASSLLPPFRLSWTLSSHGESRKWVQNLWAYFVEKSLPWNGKCGHDLRPSSMKGPSLLCGLGGAFTA